MKYFSPELLIWIFAMFVMFRVGFFCFALLIYSLPCFSFCLFVVGLFALRLLPFVSFHFILICVLIEPELALSKLITINCYRRPHETSAKLDKELWLPLNPTNNGRFRNETIRKSLSVSKSCHLFRQIMGNNPLQQSTMQAREGRSFGSANDYVTFKATFPRPIAHTSCHTHKQRNSL